MLCSSLRSRDECPRPSPSRVCLAISLGALGTEEGFIIVPGDPDNSTLYLRLLTFSSNRMPPVASTLVDWEGSDLIRRWIASMDQPTAIEGLATVPEEAGLEQNFPNPFNAQTTIVYQVGETGPVELALYDGVGQKVRTLVQAEQAPGSYFVRWDGRTANGGLAASGTYLYRLRMGDYSEARQLMLVR